MWYSMSNFFIPLVMLMHCYGKMCSALWTNYKKKKEAQKVEKTCVFLNQQHHILDSAPKTVSDVEAESQLQLNGKQKKVRKVGHRSTLLEYLRVLQNPQSHEIIRLRGGILDNSFFPPRLKHLGIIST